MAESGRTDVLSLAQGVVHWQPPPEAIQLAARLASSGDASVSQYGPAEGLPALRDSLLHKLRRRNGLSDVGVMVTAGANQAFVNIAIGLVDPGDKVVLFTPFYFNHRMAFQMTGSGGDLVYGPCDPVTLHPDLDWLEAQMAGPRPPRMVVLVNPCNPTGVLMSREEVERAVRATHGRDCWLVLDNTYEDFVYGGREHHCCSARHVLNVFSFSKAYGMMGWRVGYIAYPDDGSGSLGAQLLKVQDTIPICPTQLSQRMALEALEKGGEYVASRIRDLEGNRAAIVDALSPLGQLGSGGVAGGEGAIYLWARLPPEAQDDEAVVAWLIREHGVCVIPGSACGAPGYIRAAYANQEPAACAEAAARLKRGLLQLVQEGLPAAAAASTRAVATAGGPAAAP